LRTGDGRKLPPHLKAEIVRELQRLELVLAMIKTIEAERKAIISAKTPHVNVTKIQDLIKINSIGPGIATVLIGEVFYRKFNNRQQLGRAGDEPFPERRRDRQGSHSADHHRGGGT
jgi:transposase